jgi:hypothetical protein
MRTFTTLEEDKHHPPPSYHSNVHTTLLVFHALCGANINFYADSLSLCNLYERKDWHNVTTTKKGGFFQYYIPSMTYDFHVLGTYHDTMTLTRQLNLNGCFVCERFHKESLEIT